ncbi:MAG: hypothetical protein U0586_16830 [Candidatus Brocadiaceae bacterium]
MDVNVIFQKIGRYISTPTTKVKYFFIFLPDIFLSILLLLIAPGIARSFHNNIQKTEKYRKIPGFLCSLVFYESGTQELMKKFTNIVYLLS